MTKKILFFLIALTTFTNVSYASFPVTETQQTEIVETNNAELPTYKSGNPTWGILSVISAALGILLVIAASPASLLAFLLAIIFGAIGFKHKPNGLAIAGFIIGILPFALMAVILIVFLVGILFFDWEFVIM
jgi:hypothetical protein